MVRASLLLLVVCFAAVALQTQSVQASCGDWLDHSEIVRPQLGSSNEHQPVSPVKPCDGPACQGSPLPPMTVTFKDSTVVREYEVIAGFRFQNSDGEPQQHESFYDETWQFIPAYTGRIERPPRS